MKTLYFTLAISSIVMLGGCVAKKTEPASEAKVEYFVFVASDLPSDAKSSVGSEVNKLIATANAGEVIHVIATPIHDPVSSFTVPAGSHQRRIRQPDIRSHLERIGRFLREPRAEAQRSIGRYQIDPLAIARTIQSLKRTPAPARIILVGNPIYDDQKQAGWSMTNAVVPSDASLGSEFCPFSSSADFPPGTDIRWLTSSPDWGQNENHRAAVTRFYQLYFQKHHGRLSRMTNDSAAAFASVDGGDLLATPTADPDESPFVGMVSVLQNSTQARAQRQSSQIPVAQSPTLITSASSAEVEQMIQQAQANTDKIFLAINWVTVGQGGEQCDIDLWIGSRGSTEELNYRHLETPFGRLYRDIRAAGTIEGNADEFLSWECAEISHNRLEDLTVWLDVYWTNQPVRVRVVVVWNGQIQELFTDLNASRGDEASHHLNRTASDAWTRLNLTALFPDEFGTD